MNKNTSIPNELIGVCVVLLEKNKVVLGIRKNSYRAGYYGLPSGRVEHDESLMDSAKRELFEETGLKCKKLKFIGVIRDFQEDNHTFIHFAFLCNKFTGEPRVCEPDKCDGWERFNPNDIPEQTLPGHKAAIDILLKNEGVGYREVSSV